MAYINIPSLNFNNLTFNFIMKNPVNKDKDKDKEKEEDIFISYSLIKQLHDN